MIILLTLMWIFSLDTSQCVSFRYTKISCLENYKLNRTNQDKLTCTGEHIVNHCIPDDQQKEMEVCVRMKWIISGYCPYYDTFSDAIKERHCSLYCLRKDNSQDICICPSSFNDALCTKKCGENFLSDKYVSCEHGGVSTEISPTSGGHDTRKSTESPVDFSTTLDAAFGINGTNTPPESQFVDSALGTALGVTVPLILPVVVGILLFKRRRDKQGTSKEESPVERGEVEALLSTGTKYHEENERNDQQQKRTSKEEPAVESGEGDTLLSMGTKCQEENEQNDKQHEDERTPTEAMESSPLLARNTNENQSEEDSEKNGDTSEVNKLDSSQKIDPYLTPPTSPSTAQDILTNDVVAAEKKKEEVLESKRTSSSPGEVSASGTEDNLQLSSVDDTEKQNMVGSYEGNQSDREGNEEDTSNETERKDAVGIFVNSLESIMKEDDEEVGSSELQELLEYMCTGAARKILFNVVREYVDNPDSCFQDKSKKASLKTVLPPEYHSALKHESEYRKPIPVIYAILQLSLSAEHQPKSGWGQEVKDTDTGVGDDVERVYKVHMLSREIHTPEEISVDGHMRLFEMLIGAVDRLDVKGKCSEDYREIVRRWENIQRKQWMKDKWNTFTNLIKKWSE